MNTVAKQKVVIKSPVKSEVKAKVKLTLISTPKTGAECLAEIRQMLNNKTRNPAYVFDNKLTSKQREMLMFSAGLTRSDLSKKFSDLNETARINIKNAILLCGNIFSTFNEASALETKKFIQ